MYDLVMEKSEPAIDLDALDWAMGKKKWNAAKLSQVSGVSTAVFSLLFQGKRTNISSANLARIADALEVSTDFLMGLTTNPYRQSPADMNPAIAEIVSITKKLPRNRQQDLLRMAKMFGDAIEKTSLEETKDEFNRLVQIAKESGHIEILHEFLIEILEAADEADDQLEPGNDEDSDDNAIDSDARPH